MSQWTHVAGCIRIDHFIGDLNPDVFRNDIKKSFGNTCDFYDNRSVWDCCNVPCGSEGSIQYDMSEISDDSLEWGLIYIWGDLRDYTDYQEIYRWIKKSCEPFIVRQCAVEVECEFGEWKYFIHCNKESKIVMTKIRV
jgi:hypothetical protein